MEIVGNTRFILTFCLLRFAEFDGGNDGLFGLQRGLVAGREPPIAAHFDVFRSGSFPVSNGDSTWLKRYRSAQIWAAFVDVVLESFLFREILLW